jgi:hypothetical protein
VEKGSHPEAKRGKREVEEKAEAEEKAKAKWFVGEVIRRKLFVGK